MTRRVLAIASGGGHWHQLMELRPAFENCDVTYATTLPGLAEQFGAAPAVIVPDCSRDAWGAALPSAWAILRLLVHVRPHVVISTGALPGAIALLLGKTMGARTVWVDSVANAEEMSLSGRIVRRFADDWLSQWAHVAEKTGAEFAGSIL